MIEWQGSAAKTAGAALLSADPNSALVSAFVYGAEWCSKTTGHNGIHEDELPEGYPYDEMFPYSWVDVVRMFPSEEFVRGYLASVNEMLERSKLCEVTRAIDSGACVWVPDYALSVDDKVLVVKLPHANPLK